MLESPQGGGTRPYVGGLALDFLLHGGLGWIKGEAALRVLVAMLGKCQASKRGCWRGLFDATHADLADLTGLSARSIPRAVRELAEVQAIRVVRSGNQHAPSRYQLSKALWRWSEWSGAGVIDAEGRASLSPQDAGERESLAQDDAGERNTPSQGSAGEHESLSLQDAGERVSGCDCRSGAYPSLDLSKSEERDGTAANGVRELNGELHRRWSEASGRGRVAVDRQAEPAICERLAEGRTPDELVAFIERAAHHPFWRTRTPTVLIGRSFGQAFNETAPANGHAQGNGQTTPAQAEAQRASELRREIAELEAETADGPVGELTPWLREQARKLGEDPDERLARLRASHELAVERLAQARAQLAEVEGAT